MSNNEISQPMELPAEIQHLLEENYLRVQPPIAFKRVWQRLITAEQKELLQEGIAIARQEQNHDDLSEEAAAYHYFGSSVGVWMYLHDITQHAAIVELAQQLNFLSGSDADWIRQELVIPDPEELQPNWNPETGQLKWGVHIIRSVKIHSEPSNIQRVLDAFAEEGWPATIYDPLTNGPNPPRLHDTVRSLNNSLSTIRFHATSGGERICWERSCL